MKKPRNYSFYIILGLPVAVVIFLTNGFEWSGLFNIFAGFIMTLYCMYTYFKPGKKNDTSSLVNSFFFCCSCITINFFLISATMANYVRV